MSLKLMGLENLGLPSIEYSQRKNLWRRLSIMPEKVDDFEELYSISFGDFEEMQNGKGDFQEVVLGVTDRGGLSVVAATGEINVYKLNAKSAFEEYVHKVEVYEGEKDYNGIRFYSGFDEIPSKYPELFQISKGFTLKSLDVFGKSKLVELLSEI